MPLLLFIHQISIASVSRLFRLFSVREKGSFSLSLFVREFQAVSSSDCRLRGELTEAAARQPKLWQIKREHPGSVPFVHF